MCKDWYAYNVIGDIQGTLIKNVEDLSVTGFNPCAKA